MNDDDENLQYASTGSASAGFAVADPALGILRRPGTSAVLGAAAGSFWRSLALTSRVSS